MYFEITLTSYELCTVARLLKSKSIYHKPKGLIEKINAFMPPTGPATVKMNNYEVEIMRDIITAIKESYNNTDHKPFGINKVEVRCAECPDKAACQPTDIVADYICETCNSFKFCTRYNELDSCAGNHGLYMPHVGSEIKKVQSDEEKKEAEDRRATAKVAREAVEALIQERNRLEAETKARKAEINEQIYAIRREAFLAKPVYAGQNAATTPLPKIKENQAERIAELDVKPFDYINGLPVYERAYFFSVWRTGIRCYVYDYSDGDFQYIKD